MMIRGSWGTGRAKRDTSEQHHFLGQAEVHDLDMALGSDHDVGGLQIPVHDVAAVGYLQRLGDLQPDFQRCLQGKSSFSILSLRVIPSTRSITM